ncbi:MAG: hypothetical protein HC939_03280 [Pleurocapsa sp. SU_5_0]|nr:hypothetical protein [Pleurocapsa sp. SU_5_0]NJR47739.1 hypothetical protein [Hyellaceae cyanobacterium CSU_1_1]
MNLTLGCKLLNSVISQAKEWGFICQYQESSSWLIFSLQPDRKWKLQQDEDRWILIVGNIPQLRLHTSEAIAFLKRYHTKYHQQND